MKKLRYLAALLAALILCMSLSGIPRVWAEGDEEPPAVEQPEEQPTMPVRTQILQLPKPQGDLSFAKFDFDGEEPV